MVREEFLQLVSNTGMATIKDLRRISIENKSNDRIGEFDLLTLQTFNEERFAQMMGEKYAIAYRDLSETVVNPEVLKKFRKKYVIRTRFVPIEDHGNKIVLATFDPLCLPMIKDCADLLGKPAEAVITTISAWQKIFANVKVTVDEVINNIKLVDPEDNIEQQVKAEDIGDDIVTYVNRILADAYLRGASDIHVEPYEKRFRIRFRIDGNLHEISSPPRQMMLPMISRLKIMAELDISEKRKPQDGRIKLKIGEESVDFRVSSLPTLFGEKVVLRILDQANLQLDMTKLGFMPKQLSHFKQAILQPYGMCLVTGPTGSGKTTTLYSALSELNTPDTNISTAEDPCEFNLEGINQVNVRKDIGLTFASALKSFLRQDPDVIMVGEIRDLEVGEIAVEAALTGHLVLSTLHTNDAPSAVTRLLNMGIEPFLVVASLNVIVAQRLLKSICEHCKEPLPDASKELTALGVTPEYAKKITVYKGRGCPQCANTGYKGRVAVHEVLPMTAAIKDLILSNASSDEIKKQAIYEGMRTLRMAALIKVAMGITTMEEAVANSASDQ